MRPAQSSTLCPCPASFAPFRLLLAQPPFLMPLKAGLLQFSFSRRRIAINRFFHESPESWSLQRQTSFIRKPCQKMTRFGKSKVERREGGGGSERRSRREMCTNTPERAHSTSAPSSHDLSTLAASVVSAICAAVSYTHLTLPTILRV